MVLGLILFSLRPIFNQLCEVVMFAMLLAFIDGAKLRLFADLKKRLETHVLFIEKQQRSRNRTSAVECTPEISVRLNFKGKYVFPLFFQL